MTRRAILLVLAFFVVATAPVAASGITDVGMVLNSEDKIQEYEQSGTTTANLIAPDLSVTASKTEAGCDVSSWTYSDYTHDYLCIDYGEDIDRTLRLELPLGYVGIHEGQIESINGNATAEFKKSPSGDALIVTVDVTGPTRAVWGLNEGTEQFNGLREQSRENVANLSGIELAGESSEWQYIDSTAINASTGAYIVEIPSNMSTTLDDVLVQYHVDGEEWARAGSDSDTRKPVYTTTRSGVDDRVYIHSTTKSPPQVRYKLKSGPTDTATSIISDFKQVAPNVRTWINRLPFL